MKLKEENRNACIKLDRASGKWNYYVYSLSDTRGKNIIKIITIYKPVEKMKEFLIIYFIKVFYILHNIVNARIC